jgi:hypothetical protein
VTPVNLATGLAAGLCFDHPADPGALELQAKIRANGLERALAEVTGIAPETKLGRMILERYDEIQR